MSQADVYEYLSKEERWFRISEIRNAFPHVCDSCIWHNLRKLKFNRLIEVKRENNEMEYKVKQN